MLSIHNVEDIHLTAKGQAPGLRWIELEIISQDGITHLTLFLPERSNAFEKVERIRELVYDDAQTRPEDTPFEIEPETEHQPRFFRPTMGDGT